MTDTPKERDENMVRADLKELVERVSLAIDHASVDEQQRLLKSLREWERGDRREHVRRACSIPVRVGALRVYTEYIRNISAGGAFIRTSVPFSPGEQLTLLFSLPDQNSPVKITGHVAWNSSEGVGVEFAQPLNKELKNMAESP